MQRTDVSANKTRILIVFLVICVMVALFGRQSSEDQMITERFEPEVTEEEIRYYLENDISYNGSDQFGIQTIQDWLPIQQELAQLNLALEYFSRLNLDKLLNKHSQLEEEIDQCLGLKLNIELEKYKNEINQSQINQTATDKDASSNYNILYEKNLSLNDGLYQKKAEQDRLSAEEKELKQTCTQYQLSESETIKLNQKQIAHAKYNDEIQNLELQINQLQNQFKIFQQEQVDKEDLTKEYQKDQELAKQMSKLFKPAGTKAVEIHDQKLGGIVNVLDQNMKQYNTTEVFLNGLNFHPDIQKNQIEELKWTIIRQTTQLDQKMKEKHNLGIEIEEIEKLRILKNQHYQNAINKLEEIRKKKNELNHKIQEEKKELEIVIQGLKDNYNPQNNLQNNDKLDAQKKFKEYLYQHLKEDQLCIEKCIEYNFLKEQIKISRYNTSLTLIQKHFSALDEKFKEFKI